MFPNITPERISRVFSSNLIGDVKRVDFVPKTDKHGNFYNSAYIHFNSWCNSITVSNLQERVLDPNKEARIVYDDPWYWIILQNTSKPNPKPKDYEFKPINYPDNQSPIPEFFNERNVFGFSEISHHSTSPAEHMEFRVNELEIENAKLRERVEFLKTEISLNGNLATANLKQEFQT